jgi:hypothetical protein
MLFPRVNAAVMYLRRMHLPGSLALAGTGEPRCFLVHWLRRRPGVLLLAPSPVICAASTPMLLSFDLFPLILFFVLAWVGAVLWSCFLT